MFYVGRNLCNANFGHVLSIGRERLYSYPNDLVCYSPIEKRRWQAPDTPNALEVNAKRANAEVGPLKLSECPLSIQLHALDQTSNN